MAFVSLDTKAIDVFLSYAHEDEDMRDKLEKHLAIFKWRKVITVWHDRKIMAGEEWDHKIDEQINVADIILLLISADFLSSDYCYSIEMERALHRHEEGEACVIPVILRPCYWQEAPFGKLQALPKDAKPITTWTNNDEAYLSVAQGVRGVIERLLGSSSAEITVNNPVQESGNNASLSSSTRWKIVLGGTIDDVNKHRALEFLISVQKLLNDSTLRLIEIKSGSIVLVIESSSEAFERMKFLVQSRRLDQLLGFEIQEVFEAQEVEQASNQFNKSSSSPPTSKELITDCAECLNVLSDFYDGLLPDEEIRQIIRHLNKCPPCSNVFAELETVLLTARTLKNDDDISAPVIDRALEQLRIIKKAVH